MSKTDLDEIISRINGYKIEEKDGILVSIEIQKQVCKLLQDIFFEIRPDKKYYPLDILNGIDKKYTIREKRIIWRELAKCERKISKALCEKMIEQGKKEKVN